MAAPDLSDSVPGHGRLRPSLFHETPAPSRLRLDNGQRHSGTAKAMHVAVRRAWVFLAALGRTPFLPPCFCQLPSAIQAPRHSGGFRSHLHACSSGGSHSNLRASCRAPLDLGFSPRPRTATGPAPSSPRPRFFLSASASWPDCHVSKTCSHPSSPRPRFFPSYGLRLRLLRASHLSSPPRPGRPPELPSAPSQRPSSPRPPPSARPSLSARVPLVCAASVPVRTLELPQLPPTSGQPDGPPASSTLPRGVGSSPDPAPTPRLRIQPSGDRFQPVPGLLRSP